MIYIHESIILGGVILGSTYLFGLGLKNINEIEIKTGKINKHILLLNCTTMILSGITFWKFSKFIEKKIN